jgi:hypothetical protein
LLFLLHLIILLLIFFLHLVFLSYITTGHITPFLVI